MKKIRISKKFTIVTVCIAVSFAIAAIFLHNAVKAARCRKYASV